jgi:multidrug efflux pump subunit AcrB
MVITLIASFLVSWLALPVIYGFLSGKEKEQKISSVKKKGLRWLSFFISNPWIAILSSVILVITAVLILPNLQTGFLPEMDEGSIVLDYKSPPGTSLEETNYILQQVEKIIRTFLK